MLAPILHPILHLFILSLNPNTCPLTNPCQSLDTICARQEEQALKSKLWKHTSKTDLITIDSNLLQSYQFVLSDEGRYKLSDDTKCVFSDAQMCPEIVNSVSHALMTKQAQKVVSSPETNHKISALQSEIRKQTNIVMFLTWLIYFYIFITIQLES